ncbi:sn-glycerol-3-phosphate ABC transporter ATP-binding protein UgpC [Palleronia sediminis]|uniref:sn-glycerol-3-phosphate ABC transporter ATP-binding protein UgpC n=1 Tax=Palleronia sediminis TaxID=2547833 RepID=A0A4R6AK07_9RHOB|nr:sn-glycerol-3-phosphate ABC transporter ATP-binding protein UgpC [Palleronia sediminis]TDL83504.1 sn-glycerol-3-phosphate ABC transporter ATP-binding protein UgpC [Palleronia sediminis]
MSQLVLRKVRKSFGRIDVIHGVDLEVRDGEFVVFVGPSGCGKSTLLRMIAGLEPISGGEIAIGDEVVNDIAPADRGIAMVFQSYALYPHKDVYGNMAFALRHAGEDKAVIDKRVRHAADILGLEPLLKRKPKELSGGQRQRVAIGRAIVRDPEIFLFDEPLSNLDAALRVQMRVEILRLHKRLKTTMIYVTHDQVEAMTLADRIVVLRDGRIEQVGTPLELYHHPENRFVAGFIGSPRMNFLPAARDGQGHVTAAGSRPLDLPVEPGSDVVELGIRPEHVGLCAAGEGHLTGEVLVAERLGGETFLHVDLGEPEPFVVRADGSVTQQSGESVGLRLRPESLHVFDGEGRAHPHRERHALIA